jgi:hypothetical protein
MLLSSLLYRLRFSFVFCLVSPFEIFFLLSVMLPICGRNCSVMRSECYHSVELFCAVHLQSIMQRIFQPEGRHIVNGGT